MATSRDAGSRSFDGSAFYSVQYSIWVSCNRGCEVDRGEEGEGETEEHYWTRMQ